MKRRKRDDPADIRRFWGAYQPLLPKESRQIGPNAPPADLGEASKSSQTPQNRPEAEKPQKRPLKSRL